MGKFLDKPAEAAWVGTYLTFANMKRGIAFYQDGLGMTLGTTLDGPDGVPAHAEFHYKGVIHIMATVEGAFGGQQKAPVTSGAEMPWNFYLYSDDVNAAFDKAKAAGATVIQNPEDQFWGDRTAMIIDTEGYSWMIASKVGEFDHSKIPQG